jgi:hypothetical protein
MSERTILTASPEARAALEKARARLAAPPAAAQSAHQANTVKPQPTPPQQKPNPQLLPAAAQDEQQRPSARQQRRSQRKWTAAKDLIAVLCQRWPLAFCKPRVPLAIGIGKELFVLLGEETSKVTFGMAMRHWISRSDYLGAVARGEVRRNLDGSPASEPTEGERQNATHQLQLLEVREAAEAFRHGVEASTAPGSMIIPAAAATHPPPGKV